jgi:hypothetical protein
MLSYTTPRAKVQQVLLRNDVPCADDENLHVQKVLSRIKRWPFLQKQNITTGTGVLSIQAAR